MASPHSFKHNFTFGQRFKYGFYQFADHFLGRERSFKLMEKGRRNFYKKLHENLKAQGEGKVYPVDRVKNLSKDEFFKKYVRYGIPVVFEGAAKEWRCTKEWSLDYFKQLHGDDEIVMVDQIKMENPYLRMTLAEVIDNIRKGSGQYYRFYPLLDKHPEHIKDFDYNWLLQRRTGITFFDAFQVFIGGAGTVTPLHNANQCNLFVQAHGEKHWRLYSHYHTMILDPAPVRNVYRSAPFKKTEGPFDPFNPEYETPYTLYKYIDSISVELQPGDVFWNPPFYWHAVKNMSDSIGVGYRWLAPFYAYKISPLYSFLDTCATNPPVWKGYKLYRKDINLIHLAEFGKLDQYLEEKKQEEKKKKTALA